MVLNIKTQSSTHLAPHCPSFSTHSSPKATMFKLAVLVPAFLAATAFAWPPPVFVNPLITLPSGGMEWPVGSTQNVTWEYPADVAISQNTGKIVLGHQECDTCSENLDIGNSNICSFHGQY